MAEGPLARAIRAKLGCGCSPTHLQVLDESPRHGGPPGAESHFAVVVVSERFAGLPPLQRHRLVHAALDTELAGPLHAHLAIVARTPQQWQQDPTSPPRPPCLGGSKQEHPAGGERGAPRDQ
ncbi:LOW QUALITY PROTEIN: bolA-like protein 1 [Falco biarmicus]|uniref:LOW QUALITY PROTEIN: bolA-like protein 1 n=1 Tax=Falco biarmicus TaxID=345155 RepID=UPI0024BCE9FE|nr:LOW QUALITY PROTEIN: bolA-like protein 1 [Falco biarmicus]